MNQQSEPIDHDNRRQHAATGERYVLMDVSKPVDGYATVQVFDVIENITLCQQISTYHLLMHCMRVVGVQRVTPESIEHYCNTYLINL